jgi:hypothetical protein
MSGQSVVIVEPNVYSFGSIQGSNGASLNSIGAAYTSNRVAAGRYQITYASSLGTNRYGIQLTVEDTTARDSIEIHYINQTATGFLVQIHEGDNGGTANTYIDRNFNFHVIHQ